VDEPKTVDPPEDCEDCGRVKYVRAYPLGNLRDQVARTETLDDLRLLVREVRGLNAGRLISARTLRKVQAAVDVRKLELEGRKVILAPQGRRSPGGIVLP
jgi:hypothetical protein